MMNDAHRRGIQAALARFKLANMQLGAAGYNPTVNGQASAPSISPPSLKPPTTPAAPMAGGAMKSKVLG